MAISCCRLWRNINRKKPLDINYLDTKLNRCLGIANLTLLGVSGMLGAGLYVLTGAVAKDTSGPAITLSYMAAAIAAFMSALCYAEFGARIPTTGSSYIFTYVTMGELWGFLMGWNMVLEHGVGASSVAKAWSGYLDSVLGYPISAYLSKHLPLGDGQPLGEYPDFVAAAIIVALCLLVATGTESSTRFNMVFAVINIAVVLFIIVSGFCLADVKNWTQVRGGFVPFGVSGIIAGASRCFFAFAGFDVIASSSEEARNPQRDIPIALAVSLIVVTISYVGVSAVLTLMVPWFDIVPKSAIPDAYGRHAGWHWAQIIVTIGSLCTMTTSMFSGLFVLPRILYAISKDGLLCPILSDVSERRQVPIVSVIFTSLLCGLMALLFDLETLVQFMSIGTLTAYSFVAACVILLRYDAVGASSLVSTPNLADVNGESYHDGCSTSRNSNLGAPTSSQDFAASQISAESKNNSATKVNPSTISTKLSNETSALVQNVASTSAPMTPATDAFTKDAACLAQASSDLSASPGTLKLNFRNTFIDRWLSSFPPSSIVIGSLLVALISSVSGMLVLTERWTDFSRGVWWVVLFFTVSLFVTCSSLFIIFAHEQVSEIGKKSFRVPFVPFLPFLCICTNVFFMLKLQAMTWIRLVIWISVGLVIYFLYGYHKSQLNPNRDEKDCLMSVHEKLSECVVGCRGRAKDDQEELLTERK